MMKCLLITLFVSASAIAVTHPANANEVNASPNISPSQAADLTQKPVATTSNVDNPIYQADKLNQISDSIPTARSSTSQPVNPLDFFKTPKEALRQLSQQKNHRTPHPVDPLGFFKVPPLDGGLSVRVSRF